MANAWQVIERHIAAFNAKDQDAEPWSADAELWLRADDLKVGSRFSDS